MLLIVSIARQQMDLLDDDGGLLRRYAVSTSRYGLGSLPGSYCTPLGRFRIAQKIGQGAPERTLFRSRAVVGVWDGEETTEDYVLTRILWLEGLEDENANTFSRYIYLHGTNHEAKIGQPASQGCIRLSNADVIELFDLVELGVELQIGDVPLPTPNPEEFV